MSAPWAAEAFQTSERYQYIRTLGEGAHGVVLLARTVHDHTVHPSLIGRFAHLSNKIRGETGPLLAAYENVKDEDDMPPLAPDDSTSTIDLPAASSSSFSPAPAPSSFESLDGNSSAPHVHSSFVRDPPPGTLVAVKRLRLRNRQDGLNMETVREIKLLQELRHPGLVAVYRVFAEGSDLFMVMEALPSDLEKLIRKHSPLSAGAVKCVLRQLLLAVAFLHERRVLHRDLKPGNCLLSAEGVLKLADFGGAKPMASPGRRLSPEACTRFYKAPELIFGATAYGAAADMWSVGCIFAELLTGQPLFPGNSDIEQSSLIFALLGAPTEETWAGVTALPCFLRPARAEPTDSFEARFPSASAMALSLLKQLLRLTPADRLSAREALQHPYFREEPPPIPPAKLPGLAPLLDTPGPLGPTAALRSSAFDSP